MTGSENCLIKMRTVALKVTWPTRDSRDHSKSKIIIRIKKRFELRLQYVARNQIQERTTYRGVVTVAFPKGLTLFPCSRGRAKLLYLVRRSGTKVGNCRPEPDRPPRRTLYIFWSWFCANSEHNKAMKRKRTSVHEGPHACHTRKPAKNHR